MIQRKRRQRRAYYNNVPFFIEVDELSGGHRIVKHEFPYQKEPFTEDLGIKGKEYSILGFLAGQNYKVEKEKLVTELDKLDVVGVLKHPYVGTLNVRCSNYRVIEINNEVGFIRVQMLFLDAGVPYEQVEEAPGWALGQSIVNVFGSAYNSVANTLTKGEDAFAVYLDTLNSYTEAIEDKMVPFMRLREGFEGLRVTIDQNREALSNVLGEPGKLWSSILNVFKTPEKFVAPDIFVSILLSRFPNTSLSPVEATRLALASESIVNLKLDNPKKLNDIETQLTLCIDDFLYSYPEITLFNSIQSLKIEMINYFQEIKKKQNLVLFITDADTNSILLSYDLFGDLSKEQVIFESNPLMNPALIPSDEKIWVPAYE